LAVEKEHFMYFSRLVILGLALAIFAPTAAFCRPHQSASAVPSHSHPKPLPWAKPGWNLTFHDEFAESVLDRRYWADCGAHGERTHGDDEQEYYAPDGYTLSGGCLHLNAERRAEGGKPYTSAMIQSYGHFAQVYGWFEIRAKFPAGKGMWPAFWLLPETGAWPPEIDVLEILGHQPNVVYMTNHWVTGTHQQKGASWTGPDFSQGFHTFAIDWEPGLIVWYVDGIERARSTSVVPAEPMYLVANLAVGGSWPGNPDAMTSFPASMDIDYIRVYQKDK
jgi:beta-glucanase (GH16 family)